MHALDHYDYAVIRVVPRVEPDLDIESVSRHLQAVTAICRGGPGTGPIGQLPPRARFHWLTAKRSSILQTSPVHTGKCSDMDAIMEHLLRRLVR